MTGAAVTGTPAVPAAELDAFAHTRFFFGHQSVGSDVLGGIAALYANRATAPRIVETREALPDPDPCCAHAHVGANGDPHAKLEDFAAIVNGPLAGRIDAALLKLCYADVTAASDVERLFGHYATTMDALQAGHPGTVFLYSTVPVTTDRSAKSRLKAALGRDNGMGPADNLARRRYNDLIRERFAATGRLFDIAAVTAAPDRPGRRHRGQRYAVLDGRLARDAGHLNDPGAAAVAAALVRVVARSTR